MSSFHCFSFDDFTIPAESRQEFLNQYNALVNRYRELTNPTQSQAQQESVTQVSESILPKVGMRGTLYTLGKQVGFVAKGNSVKVRLDSNTIFMVQDSKSKGYIRFAANVSLGDTSETKYIDKRWGTHGGIEQKGKKKGYDYNHEVHGYSHHTGEKNNPSQTWRPIPVENGFLLTCECAPELFLYFDKEGVARCGPREKAHTFTFVPK